MSLKLVTFTGADDHTDIGKLLDISKEFPWIEWGILLPPKGGYSRFPSVEWLAEFVGCARVCSHRVRLAGHICPPWTKPFLLGEIGPYEALTQAFDRIQINTHGEPHHVADAVLARITNDMAREYILQRDGANEQVAFGTHTAPNVTGLFDLSHGAGVVPDEWTEPPYWQGDWVGLAGGLGPENILQELPKILVAAGKRDCWIDMETKVRTSGYFDLHKVRAVIEHVSATVKP